MDDFDTPPINLQTNQHAFLVDVDGYEGPLSVLLNLARTQKVDLRKISVLKLAEQYLAFIEKSKALRLELAADYLVMAAWLAFLKSRLLLPVDPTDDAPSGAELAARLAFQLERLEAMRKSAARLMGRDQMGRDFFARGTQESVSENLIITYRAGVLDLMQAYARLRTRDDFVPLHTRTRGVLFTMEQAYARMRGLLGTTIEWAGLEQFLPDGWREDAELCRSATASTFMATLELARQGKLDFRQAEPFSPLEIKGKQA